MRLITLLPILVAAHHCLGEVRYQIVQLEAGGDLPTYASYAVGVNNRGQVVGSFISADYTFIHVFLYSQATGMVDLGPEGAPIADAWRINDLGQIAGWTTGGAAFRYTPGVGFEFLAGTTAHGINNRGQVAGDNGHAFRYTDGIGIEDLGDATRLGAAINEQGWVVGVAPGEYAFLYRDGQEIVNLGPGGATDINDRGVVVGQWWGMPAVDTSPVVWTNGQPHLLGTFGGIEGIAYAINNKNQVVGEAERSTRSTPGFIWTEEEGMQDLNTLVPTNSGWFLGMGYDINEEGWIVGNGYYQPEDKSEAYLLVPIPPKLQIVLVGTNVVITWSPHWPRLVLETTSYYSPTNWQAVPGGTNDPVVFPATGPGQIFRLTQYESLDPRVAASVSGTNLVISWVPPWPDYTLESASSMPPDSWHPIPGATNSPTTLPLSVGPAFFRLRK